ncbi:MAG: polymer-forming cytoskeletal protein [Pseudomonadota bacterium]
MALWDKPESGSNPVPGAPPRDAMTAPPAANIAPRAAGNSAPISVDPARAPRERVEMKESIIASGLSIEGKIIGAGHVRVAGKFKGDVQVEGNLHIDAGARVEGQVRASEVIVTGELQGNIESAKRVELQQGGAITGDVKAGSLTVAAGSKMRGTVEFGWEDSAKPAAILTDKGRSNVA